MTAVEPAAIPRDHGSISASEIEEMADTCQACSQGLTCTGTGKLDGYGIGDAFEDIVIDGRVTSSLRAAGFKGGRLIGLAALDVDPIRINRRRVNYSAAITSDGLRHGQVIEANTRWKASDHPFALVWMVEAPTWTAYALIPESAQAQAELGLALAWSQATGRQWASLLAYRAAGSPRLDIVTQSDGTRAIRMRRPTRTERRAMRGPVSPAVPLTATTTTPPTAAEDPAMSSDLRFPLQPPSNIQALSDVMGAENTRCNPNIGPIMYGGFSASLADDGTETLTISPPTGLRFRYLFAQTEGGGAAFTADFSNSNQILASGTNTQVYPEKLIDGVIPGGEFQRNGGRGLDFGQLMEVGPSGSITVIFVNLSGAASRIYFRFAIDPTSGQ